MSDLLGPIVYGSNHSADEVFLGRDFNSQKDYSENTAAIIDSEIKRIISEAYELAERLLSENMDKMHFIAEFLIKNEIMDEYQFEAAMNGTAATVEELERLSEERKQQSKTENEEKAKREADERKAREEEERRKLDELLGRVDPNHRPQSPSNNDYPNPPEGSDNK
jgi:cell division protease FtsH